MMPSRETAIVAAEPWRAVLNQWLAGKDSPRTRVEYRKLIVRAMRELGSLDGLTPEALAAYRGRLMQRVADRTLSTSAVATAVTALRGFLRFARLVGAAAVPDDALAELLRRPRVNVERPYAVATGDEVARLIDAANRPTPRALIGLFNETGARCSELLTVRVCDVYADETGRLIMRITRGKGGKARSVPLSTRAAKHVHALLLATGRTLSAKDESPLFMGRGGRPLSTSRARQVLSRARLAGGLAKAVSPHALRHTAAIRWLRKSGNVNAVSKLLGHSSIATTSRYVDHLDLAELAAVVE